MMAMDMLAYGLVVCVVLIVLALDRSSVRWIQRALDWFPSILLAYVIPATIVGVSGLDFSESTIFSASKMVVIPLAIVSVMSSLSIGQLRVVGVRPMVLFGVGALSIAVFPVLLIWVFRDSSLVADYLIEEEYWKGLMPVVGSWIGGSTSQLVLKELVDCPDHIFLTVFVLDNILVNLWTMFMFQLIRRSDKVNQWMGIEGDEMVDFELVHDRDNLPIGTCLLVLGVIVALFAWIEIAFVWKVIALSAVGLGVSNLMKGWNHFMVLKVAHIAIIGVMAILGFKLDFAGFVLNPFLLIFLVVWLCSHLLVMTLAAKVLNLNFSWVPIASMANVGGIATAPAVTAAYRKDWMPFAVVLAILSMATGTFFGMLTIGLFRWLIG